MSSKKTKNINFETLKKVILENSVTKVYETALYEWKVSSTLLVITEGQFEHNLPISVSVSSDSFVIEPCVDSHVCTTCKCTKQHLKWLFRIVNKLNGNELFPIGSECIKRFGNQEMINQMIFLKNIFDNVTKIGEKTFHHSRAYEGRKIKDIVKDTSFLQFLISKRKPSKDLKKNHDYDELILFYKFKNNETIEFQDYAKEQLNNLFQYQQERKRQKKLKQEQKMLLLQQENMEMDTVGHALGHSWTQYF
jgi:hypothetical protein